MLYHAILQLNQKANKTTKAKTKKGKNKNPSKQMLITSSSKMLPNKTKNTKQTKKAQSQSAFNKQNTIDRRNEIKKLMNTN